MWSYLTIYIYSCWIFWWIHIALSEAWYHGVHGHKDLQQHEGRRCDPSSRFDHSPPQILKPIKNWLLKRTVSMVLAWENVAGACCYGLRYRHVTKYTSREIFVGPTRCRQRTWRPAFDFVSDAAGRGSAWGFLTTWDVFSNLVWQPGQPYLLPALLV